jgi:2-polyprenyl-3-methyl-5-hydroxy-6-metoxy-1,4-benzoquinol methylase
MQLITDEYRKLNTELHAQEKKFGTMGGLYARDVMSIVKEFKTEDILDYGCGKGTLADNLPFTIKQYDPAIEKHDALPEPADIVICTDVLEHIEPEYLDEVLTHIASLTKKIAYVTACTMEAKKTLPDGRNAHLIVKPTEWWGETFAKYFKVKKVIQGVNQVIAILEPKDENKDKE